MPSPSRKLWAESPAAPRTPSRSPPSAATASSRPWRTRVRAARKKPRNPAATRAVARFVLSTALSPSGKTSSRATATTTPPVSASRVGRRSEKRRPIRPPIRVARTVRPASGIASAGISAAPLAAAWADAAQEDVVGGDLEVGALADPLDRPLQRRVRERHQPPAADADHVVVVPSGFVALEGDDLAADVDPVDELELLELLEGAVDAGAADARQTPVDLERRDRTTLAAEQLDHLLPRRPGAESGLVQTRLRSLRPAHRRAGYMKMRPVLINALKDAANREAWRLMSI